MSEPAQWRREIGDLYRPDRAVIDIGSNTVRLVIFSGSRRVPLTWLNEKVNARLGRDLSSTGRLPDKAMRQALDALARYRLILGDLGITDVETVATAAVRDAQNGADFLDQVRSLGLAPRLLSGEEEAQGAAFGVIGAFPGAQGTVADLGGGSLELVMIEQGDCHDGVSLPLGTLRLPVLRGGGTDHFHRAIEKEIARAGWAFAHPGPLYMVGGTWRALAAFAMAAEGYPLRSPHGFRLDPEQADRYARDVVQMSPEELAARPRIPTARAAALPDAARMLRVMLARLQPDGVVFSSWGLREGRLFQRLSPEERRLDPLLAGIMEFSESRGGSPEAAAAIAAWISPVTLADSPASRRIRLAATMLALAARHIEPDLRARHAYEWALDKRWVGLEPAHRAQIAAALLAACGKAAPAAELEQLADWTLLSDAVAWGLAMRLCRRIGAGTEASLLASALLREPGKLVLTVAPSHAALLNDKVRGDLTTLADWLALQPEVRLRAHTERELPAPNLTRV